MVRLGRHLGLFLASFGYLLFVAVTAPLSQQPRSESAPDMQVALPRFVQILMAAGDRFLAADLAGFRALVVSTSTLTPDGYAILGRVHTDVAWLNPAHEDNYYIAAAILPWNGQVGAALSVLRMAAVARPYDWQPPFYVGAIESQMLKRPIEAARWLQQAAQATQDEQEQLQLQVLAAHVLAKGDDFEQAIRITEMMQRNARYPSLAKHLGLRISRLRNLKLISSAVDGYVAQHGHLPGGLDDLIVGGLLSELPADPFGNFYELGPTGRVVIANPPRGSK